MGAAYQESILRYMDEVLKKNKELNLTRIEDDESARLLHLEDSLAGLPELERAPKGRYVDLGSGGGFPGVPLALASGRDTLLVDSVKKKMAAVSELLARLGFDDRIATYDGRIEELALEKPKGFAVATARALAKVSVLLELASPLLQTGGMLICYKAQLSDEERETALKWQSYLGMRLESEREFFLSDGETKRCILVFEKFKEPGMKLPRKVGFAQKRPLA